MSRPVSDPLLVARTAFQAHDWMRALDFFRKADQRSHYIIAERWPIIREPAQ